MIITQSNGIQLASIAQLMADGQLKIAIDRSFLLKDAACGHSLRTLYVIPPIAMTSRSSFSSVHSAR